MTARIQVCRWCRATIWRAINGRWYSRGHVSFCTGPGHEHVPETRRARGQRP